MARKDAKIKQTAVAYFRACKDAEDSVIKYARVKYDAEIGYDKRLLAYNHMINALTSLNNQET
jgi:hypothetical protein